MPRSAEWFPARLWRAIDVGHPRDCWNWQGKIESNGYGRIKVAGRMVSAHRSVWVDVYGPIPDGLYVLHRCDNRSCANPYHLFLGTNDENMADMVAKGRAPRGERNKASKLTEADVRAIRVSTEGRGILAERYSVTTANIGMIQRRATWRHVGA